MDHLDSIDGEFARKFRRYFDEFGCGAISYDVMDPTVSEMPSKVLKVVLDQQEIGHATRRKELTRKRHDLEVEALEKLKTDQDKTGAFQTILKRARLAYPTLYTNTLYTQNAGDALMRYTLLELGRRRAERKVISEKNDIFFLTLYEARKALEVGQGVSLRDLAERRIGEREWSLAHPGKPF